MGLNIRHVGWHVAQVADACVPVDRAAEEGIEEDLNAVEGIGPEIAGSIHEWFQDKENLKLLKKLAKAGVRVEDDEVAPPPEGPLTATGSRSC